MSSWEPSWSMQRWGKPLGESGFSLDIPAWPPNCRMEKAGGEGRRCPKVHEVSTEWFWSSQSSAITAGLEQAGFLWARRRRSGLERRICSVVLPTASLGIGGASVKRAEQGDGGELVVVVTSPACHPHQAVHSHLRDCRQHPAPLYSMTKLFFPGPAHFPCP